jgi:hypothetical protein
MRGDTVCRGTEPNTFGVKVRRCVYGARRAAVCIDEANM